MSVLTFNLEVTVYRGDRNGVSNMKKLKMYVFSLCLIALLTLGIPGVTMASDGPQGGSNSKPSAPPPPPPPSGTLGKVVAIILDLIS